MVRLVGRLRRHFVVGQNDATPGYLPGIEPGTWHVILGIHTVPPQGAELTVRVVSPAWNAADHGPVAEPIQRTVRGSDRGLPASYRRPAGMVTSTRCSCRSSTTGMDESDRSTPSTVTLPRPVGTSSPEVCATTMWYTVSR